MAEQQLDLIRKKGSGGARVGAGRKPVRATAKKSEKRTQVIRVPSNSIDVVKQLIKMLDEASASNQKNTDVYATQISPDKADPLQVEGLIKIKIEIERYIPS